VVLLQLPVLEVAGLAALLVLLVVLLVVVLVPEVLVLGVLVLGALVLVVLVVLQVALLEQQQQQRVPLRPVALPRQSSLVAQLWPAPDRRPAEPVANSEPLVATGAPD